MEFKEYYSNYIQNKESNEERICSQSDEISSQVKSCQNLRNPIINNFIQKNEQLKSNVVGVPKNTYNLRVKQKKPEMNDNTRCFGRELGNVDDRCNLSRY